MQRDHVERIVWKVLSQAIADARPKHAAGEAAFARADDVDVILAAVDAYTRGLRQHHVRARRPLHYAPMPATETACGIISAGNKLLRLTGTPAEVECENCKATERWRNDMTVEKVRYG